MKELNNFRKFIQENELHEGTWGLGSPESIGSIVKGLQAIINMADDAQNKKNAAGRGFVDGLKNQLKAEKWNTRLYNIVGDDEFHDAYDAAKAAAELNDFDKVKNKLGDAIMRAIELKDTILKNRGLEEGEVEEGIGDKLMAKFRNKRAAKKEKERFTKGLDMKDFRGQGAPEIDPEFTAGLEENDAVLDEMANSMGIFKDIDAMIGSIKDQMDPDDAFDSLVSEFEAISGGTKLLHRALKNISLDNNLMEEKDEE